MKNSENLMQGGPASGDESKYQSLFYRALHNFWQYFEVSGNYYKE